VRFTELAAPFPSDWRAVSALSALPDCSFHLSFDSNCSSVSTGLFPLSSATSESDETNKITCPSLPRDAYLTYFLLPLSADLNAERGTLDCPFPSSSRGERELLKERPDPDLSMPESTSVLS